MPTLLPEVACYTDRRDRSFRNPLQSTAADVRVQHDPAQIRGQAPPSWNAVDVTLEGLPWSHIGYVEDAELRRISVFRHPALGTIPYAGYYGPVAPPIQPPPTMSTSRTGLFSGDISNDHHLSSIPGRNSSFLNGTQKSKGDAEASSSLMMVASSHIAISTILEHIQEVGSSITVRNLVRMVAMKRQEVNAADWPVKAHDIRMAVIRTFNMILAGRHEIRVSPNDLQAAAAGYFNPMWSEATFRALHIAGLFIEFVKLGVNSPGDITIAAEQLLERRNCGGYLSLMNSFLQAGRNFLFPYDSVMKLRAKKEVLRSEGEPWAKDISNAVNNLRYPRRRRRNVARKV